PVLSERETFASQPADAVESPVRTQDLTDSPIREVHNHNVVSNVPISALAASPESTAAHAPEPSREPVPADAKLPDIEPSEAGTVVAVSMGKGLSLAAGESLVVEDENGGRFARVSGFDPKIVRVTARSPHRLLIEGLAPGETILTILVPENYNEALRVSVTVAPAPNSLGLSLNQLKQRHSDIVGLDVTV